MSFNPEYFFPTVITNITNLNGGALGTVKASDVYPAVDVTDVSQAPSGTTKPYQIYQLANYILSSIGVPSFAAVLAASTGTNISATYSNGSVAGQPGIGATLTNATTQTAFVLDGQAGILNARYLIKDQLNAAQNGIYTLTNIGSSTTNWVLTRAIDFNTSTTISPPVTTNIYNNGIVYVLYGAVNGEKQFQDTYSGTMTVGSTNISWNSNFPSLTLSSITFNPSTGGIVGTKTNDNASAGFVGEFISSNIPTSSPVSASSGTNLNVTSISLTPGDWDVSGNVFSVPAGSTITTTIGAAISLTSGTLSSLNAAGYGLIQGISTPAGFMLCCPTGTTRISIAATTTVYLVAVLVFSVSTSGVAGYIGARRVR